MDLNYKLVNLFPSSIHSLGIDNFDDYIKWAEEEKQKIDKSPVCRKCEYKGFCLTEHYRFVENLDNGCNGYKYLLDTYRFRYGKEKLINV